ncbi:MAG: DNA mismatch repair endonuclease MutL, partial [Planctomycetota bacterium]
ATTDPMERIRKFLGNEVADHLIAVSSESELPTGEKIRLWGYVGEPSLNRSTRKDQYLFLNGRWIQDRSLQHALQESYRGLLMVGRQPVSFLFLEVPPSMVDVNVHPTKSEVRFQDSQTLYRQLLKTLRDKFLTLEFRSNIDVADGGKTNSKELQFDKPNPAARPQKELDLWASSATQIQPPRIGEFARTTPAGAVLTFRPGSGFGSGATHANSGLRSSSNDRSVFSNPEVIAAFAVQPPSGHSTSIEGAGRFESNESEAAVGVLDANVHATKDTSAAANEDSTSQTHATDSFTDAGGSQFNATLPASSRESWPVQTVTTDRPEFRAIQIHDCYIVVASDAGLEVIDQHALHERILYEHLRNRIMAGSVERQRLLIPESLECTATECVALLESLDLLREIGFELQEFGGNTILLMSHPTLIPRGNLVRIVKDFAEQLIQNDGKMSRRDLLDHMLHTMACRAAIKSGHRLTPEEMEDLLRQRHLVDDSHHCPHGRPTSLTLSRMTLDQQFGRLG